MTGDKPHKKTLSLLRRRDRETALRELDAALTESGRIAAELDSIESTITDLNRRLEGAELAGKSSGASLQMCLDHRQVTKDALGAQRARARDLKDTAKKALAKAQQALAALEKDETT